MRLSEQSGAKGLKPDVMMSAHGPVLSPPRLASPTFPVLAALQLGAGGGKAPQKQAASTLENPTTERPYLRGLPALRAAPSHPRQNSHSVSSGFMTVVFKVQGTEH